MDEDDYKQMKEDEFDEDDEWRKVKLIRIKDMEKRSPKFRHLLRLEQLRQ